MGNRISIYALVVGILLGLSSSSFAQVIFEAEDAYISSGTVETEHVGYTGDGFVDTENTEGVYVEWTFNSYKAVNDSIGFRYALGKDENRYMQIHVNDVLVDTIDFDMLTLSDFTVYDYKYVIAPIVVGENKIKAVSINPEGAPNLDHITVKNDTNIYYTVIASSSGNGEVAVRIADSSSVATVDTFMYGTRMAVTATPMGGNIFSAWTGTISETNPDIRFTVDKDFSLEGTFVNVLPAFPGAEGFAGSITGGRGGEVIEVTNLDDSGLGSLRAAINTSGPRTIVFRVSGNIVLNSNLSISQGSVTIAGQTAPGEGITVSGYPIKVSADNVIIRYIRARLGDVNNVEDDAMNGRNHQNIIIDHCSMSWSVDETASFYDNTNFTMQYCLISESLYESVHDKGTHGYGGIWGGKGASFHHNLLAHHTSRNPRFCGSRYSNAPDLEKIDYRNNVIYNWGGNSAYGAEGGTYNIVNNYYKYGPVTSSSVKSRIISPNADDGSNSKTAGTWGEFYVNGNYVYGYESITESNIGGFQPKGGITKTDILTDVEYDFDSVTTHSAEIAFEHVLAQAGACNPFRDEVDQRIVHEVLSRTATYGGAYGAGKGIIDSQTQVGGWPDLESTTPPVDSDKDGMPDDWETARGLNTGDATDRNGDDDADGYTNLEEYLNELAAQYTYIIRPLNFTLVSSSETETVMAWEDILEGETGYLLERRAAGGEFEEIAQISADETTYTDNIPELNNYTYRLRSYNETDTSFYTDSVYVGLISGINSISEFAQNLTIYPNPFENTIQVDFSLENTEDVDIQIYSITGKRVGTYLSTSLNSGQHTYEFNTDNLKEGIYYISVQTGSQLINKKVTKL